MYRIEPRNLLWVLDSLAEGKVVNRIEVHEEAQRLARLALDRMLAHVGSSTSSVTLTD
jgi:quinolinate synthase